ncbi:uncharacterized protein HMPREF1541_07890 [Cyphellophora europaea CBS 101466]|uniref:Xylanolytic transcriptional activator regulatory domain-containing protein n=1 Tax=Cyphellophora europaea (strain CBS 101466) TaxID=1220924 RepID=W2RMJ0_CYPE1|nr:uncharacterized protein HMPREF1541_07890 [Cyphellophora europaea CBS 101466]ETN36903.1 hypothetical protein HMPREF1541_07890 [Cyphellophora europaea CBS 101466]
MSDHEGDVVLRVPAIKCDRKTPCNSCIASQIPCRTTKRAPEKKQRVLLSSKYDEGIASVNRKLEDLSAALQNILAMNSSANVNQKPPSEPPHQLPEGVISSQEQEVELPYEGDLSFIAQSRQITESLGVALASASPSDSDRGSASSIDQTVVQKLLQDVAAASAKSPPQDSPSQQPFSQYPELAGLILPPMSLVLKLLKIARMTVQRWLIEHQIMRYDDFARVCQKVYFPMEEYSIYTWIIVNGGLFNLFRDVDNKLPEHLGITRAELNAHQQLCRKNVDTAVHSLRLCVEPSLEACQSIIIGASLAMEYGQASSAWRLTCTAARMCLDLGLHRLPSGDDNDGRRKRLTFWYVYTMDKGLAFNFGRTPNVHDYDITVDRPSWPADLGGDLDDKSWGTMFLAMVEFAVLQGDIYEQLFSVSAQRQPVEVRSERARTFVQKLEIANVKDIPWLEQAKFSVLTSEMFIECLLAIVYRVIPPKQPAHPLQSCDEAVHSSRKALALLFEAWNIVKEEPPENWVLFINCTLLFVPFVPIIVIFGNTIAQRNHGDLALLRDVVSVLDGAALKSSACLKLRNACSNFTKIAETLLAQDLGSTPIKDDSSQPSPQMADPYAMHYQSMPDFPMSQSDWDGMLNEFDLGLGVESAREMTSYFEPFLSGNNNFN